MSSEINTSHYVIFKASEAYAQSKECVICKESVATGDEMVGHWNNTVERRVHALHKLCWEGFWASQNNGPELGCQECRTVYKVPTKYEPQIKREEPTGEIPEDENREQILLNLFVFLLL
jgi:hypothetical protein